ncbi:MAG: hypothetical protein RR137_04630 [Odoribacter sp.]
MKNFAKNNKILLILIAVVLLLSVYYITYFRLSVNRYVEQFEETYNVQDTTDSERIDLHRVPGYHQLLKQKGLLDGMVKLAKSDTVGLFLNLPDSTAHLMIEGMAVRNIALCQIEMNALFRIASEEALYKWLSEPLRVISERATIEKEPVNVVVAPKDSSDEVPEVVPDTLRTDPVFFILETDRGLQLYFYQTGEEEEWSTYKFDWQYRWENAKEAIKAIVHFQIPNYKPVLRIGLSKEDAQVIYRALPSQGLIVLTL